MNKSNLLPDCVAAAMADSIEAHNLPAIRTERELATVLAALRYWQRRAIGAGPGLGLPRPERGVPEFAIASDNASFRKLTTAEIDDLCERLNLERQP